MYNYICDCGLRDDHAWELEPGANLVTNVFVGENDLSLTQSLRMVHLEGALVKPDLGLLRWQQPPTRYIRKTWLVYAVAIFLAAFFVAPVSHSSANDLLFFFAKEDSPLRSTHTVGLTAGVIPRRYANPAVLHDSALINDSTIPRFHSHNDCKITKLIECLNVLIAYRRTKGPII